MPGRGEGVCADACHADCLVRDSNCLYYRCDAAVSGNPVCILGLSADVEYQFGHLSVLLSVFGLGTWIRKEGCIKRVEAGMAANHEADYDDGIFLTGGQTS